MKSLKWMLVFLSIFVFSGCGEDQLKIGEIETKENHDTVRAVGGRMDTSLSEPETPLSGRIKYTLSYSARKGKHLFKKHCVICHGESGKGDGFNAWNLQPRPRDLSDPDYLNALTDERIAEAIQEGGAGVQKSNMMPAWGKTLSKTETQQLVTYLRTLSTAKE